MIQIAKLRETVKSIYAQPTKQQLYFHTWNHTEQVEQAAVKIGQMEYAGRKSIDLLQAGALLHDIATMAQREQHEENSAKIAKEILPLYKANNTEIKIISNLILATKMPHKPSSPLDEIIIDADMSYMGLINWIEIIDGYRQEFGETDMKKWYKGQLNFLKSHQWQTKGAKLLYEHQKQKNIVLLQERI